MKIVPGWSKRGMWWLDMEGKYPHRHHIWFGFIKTDSDVGRVEMWTLFLGKFKVAFARRSRGPCPIRVQIAEIPPVESK